MKLFSFTAGAEISDVQQRVENHLHDMILKTFDPKKADAIFAEEGETPSWLAELIEYPTWRSLIYRLAEDYPDCLMLNFTIKLISDAGFQVRVFKIILKIQIQEVLAYNGFVYNGFAYNGFFRDFFPCL